MRSPFSCLGIISTAVLVLLCSLPLLETLLAVPTASAQTSTTQDRKAEADRLFQQGKQQYLNNEFQAALESFQQALNIYQVINILDGEAATLDMLGVVYSALGQFHQSLEYEQRALPISRAINDPFREANVLNNIGSGYSNLGKYSQALDSFQKALVVAEGISEDLYKYFEQESILTSIGFTHYSFGQYSQALQSYQKALEIARDINDRSGEAIILSTIGAVYSDQEKYHQAIENNQQALTIIRTLNDPSGEAGFLYNLGEDYESSGQHTLALEAFQKALQIMRGLGLRTFEGQILSAMGSVYYSIGKYSIALKHYQQALEIYRAFDNPTNEAETFRRISTLFLRTGKFLEAEENLFNAAQILESFRVGLTDTDKVEFLETQTNVYRALQLALVAQDKTDDALVAAERGRSRAFIEQLAQRLGSQTAEELLTQNIPTLEQLKQIAAQHDVTLVEYSFVYDQKVRDPNGQLYTWVVKPTGEIIFQQADLSKLNTSLADLVDSSREAIGVTRGIVGVHPRPGTEQQQAQRLKQLYQLLIEPIDDLLPSDPNAPVIFVPQGELFSVPFAALQDAKGQYLIDQHTVLTSPSIQLLDKTRQQQAQVKQANLHDVLVVGNPTMPHVSLVGEPSHQLISLAGAEKEANAIAPLLQAQPLLGGQAKKATVMQRMEQARMIHLATHGILDDRQGLDSAIALAPDGTGELNDGLLTAAEIAQMKLHAELVVLSACDTAQGRITGDGVIGLSRALITAGVPSVLVSLWSVPDAPTAELMTEFYQQLQHTDNKAQALRQAMLATKAKHPNPRDWAGFTLIGEAQ